MLTLRVGDVGVGTALPTTTVHLTRADLIRYAGASGDLNPIHWSDRFAAAIQMPGVVAHGMLTMALAVKTVTDWVGDPGVLVSCTTRFTRPVVVDELDGADITFTPTVTAVEGTRWTISVEAVCDGVKVLGGTRIEVDCG
ncbi:dehydratase [Auraticoccus sp. F435]|uniref:Dehydratase n=1 Tax=Auraticoccus cholistanensis TaxID=2656650 RepID=A0A6A9UVA7_9ACTN|nr:MaoC/PaaZ C-terminal domain-containing protein [Auraticoccus cholistanensis]MVA75562.1 dehydratase [Auraticoccus cholistanensis]